MLFRNLKTLGLALLIMLGVGLAASPAAFAQERGWQPQKTWVFIVGTLRWKHREVFTSFPQRNRRDAQLVDFFRQQGVPADQLVYLQDSQATTRRVQSTFKDFLSRARPGDLLFFYYCGHGYKSDDQRTTYFATYDAGDDTPGWAAESVVRDVEKYFKGSRALLTADSCYSGSLAEQAQRMGRRVSYAVLTSSSANELSTENWTFTEMLLAGFNGRAFADINDDRKITLGEIADGIRQDMRFAEEQGSAFVTTGEFSRDTTLAEARSKVNPEINRRVEVRSEGAWYKARIIDVRSGRFRVHYYGWEDSDDEWVRRNQIRNASAQSERAGTSWENEWAAIPVETNRDSWLIHYVDDVWDGWTMREN
ncbi:MAG: agenet domain-containing protein [Acidobacteriota bacterium]